jgi:hypothetical protein
VTLSLLLAAAGCASAKKNTAPQSDAAKATTSTGTAPSTTAASGAKAHKKTPGNPQLGKTAASGTSGATSLTCKSGDDERKLEIAADNGGCKLNYTKAGSASAIASQKQGDAKCQEVFERIQKKLVAAGYDCK